MVRSIYVSYVYDDLGTMTLFKSLILDYPRKRNRSAIVGLTFFDPFLFPK